jgi:hypothetical protein
MRKLLAIGAALTAALAVCGAATAGSIRATGAGWVSFQPFTPKHYIHFDVSAHTGPQGDFGQVGFTINDPNAPLETKTDLDCVNVFPFPLVGGGAWVAGTVTKASPQPNIYAVTPGDRLEFYLVDGGSPSGTVPVDQFQAFFEFAPCKTLGPEFGYFPNVTQGNVNISTG